MSAVDGAVESARFEMELRRRRAYASMLDSKERLDEMGAEVKAEHQKFKEAAAEYIELCRKLRARTRKRQVWRRRSGQESRRCLEKLTGG